MAKEVKKALEAEATSTTVTCQFRGLTIEVPIGDEMDISVMKAWELGQIVVFCESAVGPAQWLQLQRAGVSKVKDLKELAEVLFKAMGTSSGE